MVGKFTRIIVCISKNLPMLFGNWFKKIKEGQVRLKDRNDETEYAAQPAHCNGSQSQVHRKFKASRGYKNPVSKINKKQWIKNFKSIWQTRLITKLNVVLPKSYSSNRNRHYFFIPETDIKGNLKKKFIIGFKNIKHL